MNLKHQVCSLELAQKLKELGVKQKALCYWKTVIDNFEADPPSLQYTSALQNIPGDREGAYGNKEGRWDEKFFAAFTVAELGEMLPTNFKTEKVDLGHGGKLHWTCWSAEYGNPYEREETEADARAKMLIYLL